MNHALQHTQGSLHDAAALSRSTDQNLDAYFGVEPCARMTCEQPQREQLARYVRALYPEGDIPGQRMEVRIVTSGMRNLKRQSRVIAREWLKPSEIVTKPDRFSRFDGRACIFVGVNPRCREDGKKDSVKMALAVTADIDDKSPDQVLTAFRFAGVPTPSILVNSGHGTHSYHLLDAPFHFKGDSDREAFEEMNRIFQRFVGADFTQDVTRLLRLPGFANAKNVLNGAMPVPCTLVHCDPSARYPVSYFLERWSSKDEQPKAARLAANVLPQFGNEKRVKGLIRYLANDQVSDRSRRDFGVVLGLLKMGLSPEEIRRLVKDHSKFATNGERYFETTICNALRVLQK